MRWCTTEACFCLAWHHLTQKAPGPTWEPNFTPKMARFARFEPTALASAESRDTCCFILQYTELNQASGAQLRFRGYRDTDRRVLLENLVANRLA